MHVDYARENYHKLKFPKVADPFDDLTILKLLATDEFVDLASTLGDEKITSICETMKASSGYRYNPKSYKKITEKQRFVIANFLLDKFGTAKAVIAQAFKISIDDVALREDEL